MAETITSEGEKPARLILEGTTGWLKYGRIPYRIRYHMDIEDFGGRGKVNAQNPGKYMITPDLEGGKESLTIWIYVGVPEKFKEIVLYHELTEADLVFGDGLSISEAHKKAMLKAKAYARAYLTTQEYSDFETWDKTTAGHLE